MNQSKPWSKVVKQTVIQLMDHHGFDQAKSAAYSFILFFFPLLLFLVTLLVVILTFGGLMNGIVGLMSGFLPSDAQTFITGYISALAESNPTHLLVGAFVVMVWSASSMMATFMEVLHQAYGIPTRRSIVKERLVAIGLVFLVGIPLVALAGLIVFGSYLEWLIATHFGLAMAWFWRSVGKVVILAVTLVMIAIIYYVGPLRRQTWRGVLPGAALATGIWFLVTLAFSAYVNQFGRYNVVYGSLGGGIILLIWMYLSSLAVLIGGEFNAVLETDQTHQTQPPADSNC